jgi:hypothetical protein
MDFATATRTLAPKAIQTVVARAALEGDARESESRRSVSPARSWSSAAGLTPQVFRTARNTRSAGLTLRLRDVVASDDLH